MKVITYNYKIRFKYSKDGKNWTIAQTTVKAITDTAAIMQIESKYNYIKDIQIISIKEIK